MTSAQQSKALRGQSIRVGPSQIGNGQLVMLHPLNYKKVLNAKGGINLELTPGELMATASHHGLLPSPDKLGLSGSGFFGDVWEGLKTGGRWLKDSGVGSVLADALVPLAAPYVGPGVAMGARQLLKQTTGVGLRARKRSCKTAGNGLYL